MSAVFTFILPFLTLYSRIQKYIVIIKIIITKCVTSFSFCFNTFYFLNIYIDIDLFYVYVYVCMYSTRSFQVTDSKYIVFGENNCT